MDFSSRSSSLIRQTCVFNDIAYYKTYNIVYYKPSYQEVLSQNDYHNNHTFPFRLLSK